MNPGGIVSLVVGALALAYPEVVVFDGLDREGSGVVTKMIDRLRGEILFYSVAAHISAVAKLVF